MYSDKEAFEWINNLLGKLNNPQYISCNIAPQELITYYNTYSQFNYAIEYGQKGRTWCGPNDFNELFIYVED